MVHLNTILESLVLACKQADQLPRAVTYATVELDGEGRHSDIEPPILEFSVESIDRDLSRNSETVGMEYDDDGNEIGYCFTQWFDAVIHVELFTVEATSFNHRELDRQLRRTLIQFDDPRSPLRFSRPYGDNTYGQLPDPENPSESLDGVSWVVPTLSEPSHEFSMNPSTRTRQHTLEISFQHEYRTTELGIDYETVEDVSTPTVDANQL